MNEKLRELAKRKAVLVSNAAIQRNELALALAPWRKSLSFLDQGVAVLRQLGRHPVVLFGLVACTVALRPKRVFGWVRGGWLLWRMVIAMKQRLSHNY
jgi:hypothetical protein